MEYYKFGVFTTGCYHQIGDLLMDVDPFGQLDAASMWGL